MAGIQPLQLRPLSTRIMADREYSRSERGNGRERYKPSESPQSRRHYRRSRSRSREPTGTSSRRRDDRSASPRRRRDRSRSGSRHRDRPRSDSRHGSRRDRTRSGSRHRPRRDRTRSNSRHRSRRDRTRSGSRHRSRSRSRNRDDHERRRHKAKRRSRSRSSSNESERRKKKERKRQKKKEKKAKSLASAAEWGKHGIITEADMPDKDPEFRTWLIEEKVINPETLSKDQLKKLFKEFAEDYNTATLPHEKYYDMHAYEKRMAIVRAGESNLLEGLDTYDPNTDLQAHARGTKRVAVERESYLSKQQLEELRKVQMEREQMGKMKLLGMNIDSKTGVRMESTYDLG